MMIRDEERAIYIERLLWLISRAGPLRTARHLDNPCQFGAEWSQGGVDLWPDIAVELAHHLIVLGLHNEHWKLDNLLKKSFQGQDKTSQVHIYQHTCRVCTPTAEDTNSMYLGLNGVVALIASSLKIQNQQPVEMLRRYAVIKRS